MNDETELEVLVRKETVEWYVTTVTIRKEDLLDFDARAYDRQPGKSAVENIKKGDCRKANKLDFVGMRRTPHTDHEKYSPITWRKVRDNVS